MIVLMSDLCLGTADEREDFLEWGSALKGPEAHLRVAASARLDRLFLEFVRWKLAAAATKGVLPTLVLLGNTFDFWQSRERREAPAECLTRILEVHVEFAVAIREWMGAGGEVSLVVGSRDQALVEPSAWERLLEIFPRLNLQVQGRWTHHFSHDEAGLYAEHGSRWNPFCRNRDLSKWSSRCSAERLVQELGRRLEPRFPWLDKVESIAELLRWMEAILDSSERPFYGELIQRLLRKRAYLSRMVSPWLDAQNMDWQTVADREDESFRRGLQRVRHPKTRLSGGPEPLRFIAHGHRRTPCLEPQSEKGPLLVCPGTWCPTVTGSPKAPVIQQPLSYTELTKTEEGIWVAQAHDWRAERAKLAKPTCSKK